MATHPGSDEPTGSGSGVTVLRFARLVLACESSVDRAVSRIYRELRAGRRVVAIVDWIGSGARRAHDTARSLAPDGADSAAVASLLAAEGQRAAALLGVALGRAGVRAAVLDAVRAGLIGRGPATDAAPVAVDASALERSLASHPAVVLPGFVFRGPAGSPVVGERSGSDRAAVLIAATLGAELEFVDELDGVYAPSGVTAEGGAEEPARFASLRWRDASAYAGEQVAADAVDLAASLGVRFRVAGVLGGGGTAVGPAPTRLDDRRRRAAPPTPLRVAILGRGALASAVVMRLSREAEHVRVVGVLGSDAAVGSADLVPERLVSENAGQLLALEPDVVVDLSNARGGGGVGVLREALARGSDVVTSRGLALGESFDALVAAAAASDRQLRAPVVPAHDRPGARVGVMAEAVIAELLDLWRLRAAAGSWAAPTPELSLAVA